MNLAILLVLVCAFFLSLGPGVCAMSTEQGAGPVNRGQASSCANLQGVWAHPVGLLRDLLRPVTHCCLMKPGGPQGNSKGALRGHPALIAE